MGFPTSIELLDSGIREKISPSDFDEFIDSIDVNGADDELIESLRRLRNLLADGGRNLEDFAWGKCSSTLNHLFHTFMDDGWTSGISVVLQIISNLSRLIPVRFLTNVNLHTALDKLKHGPKMNNYLAAATFNVQRSLDSAQEKPLLTSEGFSVVGLHLLQNCDEESAKEGWIVLLFEHFWERFPEVFAEMIPKADSFCLPPIVEFLTEKLKISQVGEESSFPVIILTNLRELFFLHCNCLLQGGNRPFGASSETLFEVLRFMSPASSRHKELLATEPMVVAICGILKRCWEISIDRSDELQPRLTSDGELPKKSEFLEIMFSVWKDCTRILANILDHSDPEIKRQFQDLARTLGVIPAVLAAAGSLHINQIRNWAVQAISQLTENNIENQKEISEMQNLGDVDGKDVTVDRENGKFHFKRIPHE